MRFRFSLIGLAALGLAACNTGPSEPQAEVKNAIVQLPILPDRPGVAYFTLRTNNDPTALQSVSSPQIQRIELHESRDQGGVSRMVKLEPGQTSFSPDAPLEFKAGGKHAMLFGIDPALRPGSRVRLTFNVQPAPPVTVEAEVRAAGGGPHHGH